MKSTTTPSCPTRRRAQRSRNLRYGRPSRPTRHHRGSGQRTAHRVPRSTPDADRSTLRERRETRAAVCVCVCVCVLVAWVGAGAVVGGLAVQQAGRTERCKLQEREGATENSRTVTERVQSAQSTVQAARLHHTCTWVHVPLSYVDLCGHYNWYYRILL